MVHMGVGRGETEAFWKGRSEASRGTSDFYAGIRGISEAFWEVEKSRFVYAQALIPPSKKF